MKLNKAEKFVKRQFELGKTLNMVREAIFEKLGTWNFPPEYENALTAQNPFYNKDDKEYLQGTIYPDLIGVDYHDDYQCTKCGGRSETCFCHDDYDSEVDAQDCCEQADLHAIKDDLINSILFDIPKPGGPGWEEFVKLARADIERWEQESKLINATRQRMEQEGLDFDEEFAKWKEKKNDPQR